jgi:hypothetical protein
VVIAECLKNRTGSIPTGVWSLDLDSLRWRRRDDGRALDAGTWHYHATSRSDSSRLSLLGTGDRESDEYMHQVLQLDLEACGIFSIPSPSLGLDLAPLLESSDGCDFEISSSADPGAPPARGHKLILSVRWPHFAALVRSGMMEANSSAMTLPESPSTIKAFLRYLYTDSVSTLPVLEIANLLVLGHIYLLKRLQKLCCEVLYECIDSVTAAHIFAKASTSCEWGLRARALEYIMDNLGAVARSRGFRELSKEAADHLWDAVPEDSRVVVGKVEDDNMVDLNDDTEIDDENGDGEENI